MSAFQLLCHHGPKLGALSCYLKRLCKRPPNRSESSEELTIWVVWVSVQYSIARQVNPFLLQDPINLPPEIKTKQYNQPIAPGFNPLLLLTLRKSVVARFGFRNQRKLNGGRWVVPVLYVILHVQVIDEQGVSELGVTHSLIQWKSW